MAEPEASTLPIFPLGSVVLFPRLRVPLHIFEPRYRAMVRAALEGDRRIGMVTVLPEHQDALSMTGDPPVYPVGCEGIIEQAQRLPDGRYTVVLEGIDPFRIREEIPRDEARLYRMVHAVSRPEHTDAEALANVRSRRDEIVALLLELARRVAPERAEDLDAGQFAQIDDEVFVNAIAQAVEFPVPDKQSLLEANGVSARCDQLVALLRFRLAEHRAGLPGGGRVLH
jgi:Lon protease-like protein